MHLVNVDTDFARMKFITICFVKRLEFRGE